MEKVASTWQDQGTLTVHHLRKTVTLIRSHHARIRCKGSCGVLCQAQATAALGFAVGKFCFPKNEWRADSELCKRADPLQLKPPAYASASNLGVAMARWIKCTHQNC
jgi:hypothetical protein